MTESLRQLAEHLVYGSGSAWEISNAAFFQRHGLPRPRHTQVAGRFGWWQTHLLSPTGAEICCSGATQATAHLMLAVEALEAEGREVPTELRAAATLLLAEGAACVGWRAP